MHKLRSLSPQKINRIRLCKNTLRLYRYIMHHTMVEHYNFATSNVSSLKLT